MDDRRQRASGGGKRTGSEQWTAREISKFFLFFCFLFPARRASSDYELNTKKRKKKKRRKKAMFHQLAADARIYHGNNVKPCARVHYTNTPG